MKHAIVYNHNRIKYARKYVRKSKPRKATFLRHFFEDSKISKNNLNQSSLVFFIPPILIFILRNPHNAKHPYNSNANIEFRKKFWFFNNDANLYGFNSASGVQHLQLGGKSQFTTLDSIWFTIVTMSTVGYGDISPDIWPSKMFVIGIIIAMLLILPQKIQNLNNIWIEKQKSGGSYSSWFNNPHVVIVSTGISTKLINDFLIEFYSYENLRNYSIAILCPEELDLSTKNLLKMSTWNDKLFYLQGSPLNQYDLLRCSIDSAKACFLFIDRNSSDRMACDKETILHSWAIYDFSPSCVQYVQLFLMENKVHVLFAKYVVCEEEFILSILANNVLFPSMSTIFSLLMHTLTGDEEGIDDWTAEYNLGGGNEIYSNDVSSTSPFYRYVGMSFNSSTADAFIRYNLTMIAIGKENNESICINPGSNRIVEENDKIYYINLFKLDQLSSSFYVTNDRDDYIGVEDNNNLVELKETTDLAKGISTYFSRDENVGIPPHNYFNASSFSNTITCKTKRSSCCLSLNELCEHNINNYSEIIKDSILLTGNKSLNSIHTFICILRSANIPTKDIYNIIIMIDNEPNTEFIDTLSYFKNVYIIQGSYLNMEHLLKAGIVKTKTLVMSNRSNKDEYRSKTVSDFSIILFLQSLLQAFPKLNIISELKVVSNVRFIDFDKDYNYNQNVSKFEKKSIKRNNPLTHKYRLSFMTGNVFNSSILNTLLLQTFEKNYLLRLVKMMLGIEQSSNSGVMLIMNVSKYVPYFKYYGPLFTHMVRNENTTPFCIYRTFRLDEIHRSNAFIEKVKLTKYFVKNKMDNMDYLKKLNITYDDYDDDEYSEFKKTVKIPLINPSYNFPLEMNDQMYFINQISGYILKAPHNRKLI
ncbi:hypothetical protein A3Q56_01757 [Intoshia linei]|uniref:Potassium channel domain-containing protein n=1 Tax=Intoshia linei TaxID=1819745 RepID=A0A177B856_9BILA|nr:hypothetical protein A3Q56_01757 [Intoshia linei]